MLLTSRRPKRRITKSKMKKSDLAQVKEGLLSERNRIMSDIKVLDEMSHTRGEDGGNDAASFSIHMAEHATDHSTLETTLIQRHLVEERLAQVIDALQRLEEDHYGICEQCGQAIGVERLIAKPFARLCIECRRVLEGEKRKGIAS